MTELLTSAQMRAIEAAAIASGTVTGLDLMERAGRGVVAAVFDEWPELRGGPMSGALPRAPEYFRQDEGPQGFRAVVLCGPGNNGGDGFVVARLLRELGWAVEVFLYGEPARLPPDARVNYERWVAVGEVRALPPAIEASALEPDLVVDALFGTGLSRPISGLGLTFLDMHEARQTLWTKGRRGIAHVAVDMPSGVCSDSGRPLVAEDFRGIGEGVAAAPTAAVDLTVTFHALKCGQVLGMGPELCGKVRVCDIGLTTPFEVATLVEPRIRDLGKRAEHKYSYGHALILSGPAGRGGAARLAARGALRIGAGVVTVGCPREAVAEHSARLDAVMLREVADGEALAGMLADARINALCLGPGMGTGAREAGLVALALGLVPGYPPTPSHEGEGRRLVQGGARDDRARSLPLVGREARRLVLDADALTLIARDAALSGALHEGCVLTPHGGEFARLFPDLAAKLSAPATTGPAYSKVDATREAAARAGCTVLFKGPDTVIAAPDGRCAVNAAVYERAAPWLATAGSGDVLAGFICGLLARGFAPFDAACTGAWLHAEAARTFGPGLIAEDLPEELPKVLRALGLSQ